ncbi:hypothetical protein ACQP2F_16070 [Actinoplanes sp. CA-030573]|uniref:hypothetical protein n=1 Tax=Actinoplanes sp. CA-030573 TaxID=3239898 RepID=UPI003D8FD0F3
MNLTGLRLILTTGLLGLLAVTVTIRFWRIAGRKRVPLRIVGLLMIEVFLVAVVGLVFNRHENFYPSWQALTDSGKVVTVPSAVPGRLDGALNLVGSVMWSPPGVADWRLATSPMLIAPPEYSQHRNRTFPVIVVLATTVGAAEAPRIAAATPGALTVVLEPTRATIAASLQALPALLARDARVARGLVVLADPKWLSLAADWPSHPPVITGWDEAAFAVAADELPAPLAAPQRLPS